MNRDQKLIREAYQQVNEMSATMAYLGDPKDIHYLDNPEDLDKVKQTCQKGIRFKTAYVKAEDNYITFSDMPKEGYRLALIPFHV